MTTTVIEPGRSMRDEWRELWRHRELLYYLARRDIAVRYKQTVIGIAWAVIRPALTAASAPPECACPPAGKRPSARTSNAARDITDTGSQNRK